MQTTCKLEGGGGQKSGKFANVVFECPLITGDPAKCVEHNVEKHHIAMRLPLHWYPDRYFGSEDHNVHFSNRFIGDLCIGRAKLSVSTLAERIDFDYQRASVSGRWLGLLADGLIHLCIR